MMSPGITPRLGIGAKGLLCAPTPTGPGPGGLSQADALPHPRWVCRQEG